VNVLAFSISDNKAAVEALRTEKNVTFRMGIASEAMEEAFGVTRIPITYIVDGDGVMRVILKGGHSADEFRAALEPYLK
jgi:hypothetical protein